METIIEMDKLSSKGESDNQLADFFNLEKLQQLQDTFSEAMGVSSVIIQTDKTQFTIPSNNFVLFNELVLETKKGNTDYYHFFDTNESVDPGIEKQHFYEGGFGHYSSAIRVDGKVLGYWVIGQVRLYDAGPQQMKQYADEIEVSVHSYMNALMELPVMTGKQFLKICRMLDVYTRELAEKESYRSSLKLMEAENKRINLALEQEQIFSKSILDSLPGIFYLYSYPEMKLVRWNKNLETMLGIGDETVKDRALFNWVVSQAREELVEAIHEVIETGNIKIEAYLHSLSGNLVPFLLTGVKTEVQGQKYIVGVGIDITDHKQAQAELKESELKFRKLLESIPSPICFVDKNGIMSFRNKRFVDVFGWNETDVPEIKEWWENAYPDEEYRAWVVDNWNAAVVKATETGTDIQAEEYRVTCKSGDVRNIIISGVPIFDSFLATFFDFTELKKAEEQIIIKNGELEKLNAEKDKFLSIIGHDLRSPINAFIGLSELMAEDIGGFEIADIKDIAESMRDSATNLFRLLENLLQWARMQQGVIPYSPQKINLRATADESLSMICEQSKNKNVLISLEVIDDITVNADPNILQTVIRNLVSNAVKYSHVDGAITISAQIRDDHFVEVAVRDSGIGMDERLVENLFNIDVKTNRPGTDGESSSGFGLLLCKEFIEKHGGQIWAESQEGIGSVFYFTIPE
ncbi:MAG: PAS domain S-box protein [Bacteroidales bacterium]|nr:PAS domain S-box protein [Bacteroidales bacterium]